MVSVPTLYFVILNYYIHWTLNWDGIYMTFCWCYNNDHKLITLKHYKFIISEFCWSEVWVGLTSFFDPGFIRPKARCQITGLLIGVSGKNPLTSLFSFCGWGTKISFSLMTVSWTPSVAPCIQGSISQSQQKFLDLLPHLESLWLPFYNIPFPNSSQKKFSAFKIIRLDPPG